MYVRGLQGPQCALQTLGQDQDSHLPLSSQSEESLQEDPQEVHGEKEVIRAGEEIIGPSRGGQYARADQVFGL